MTKMEKFVSKSSTETLKYFITPIPYLITIGSSRAKKKSTPKCPYFTRKVADELRRRGFRVSLKFGRVTKKM